VILGHDRAAFLRHFQEQQVGELLDVVAVVTPSWRRCGRSPRVLDDVGHNRLRKVNCGEIVQLPCSKEAFPHLV